MVPDRKRPVIISSSHEQNGSLYTHKGLYLIDNDSLFEDQIVPITGAKIFI
jgi:hypothetical protein